MNFELFENRPLAPICSMKVGGAARLFAVPKTEKQLIEAIEYFKSNDEKYIVIGNCSNLIFPDGLYDGAVISVSGIKGISTDGDSITAYCGETLSSLARFACENGSAGFEFCHGIPGTVGGGVYMNAGAYGGELGNLFIQGEFLNKKLERVILTADEMRFGYRKSRMCDEDLILLSATFKTTSGNTEDIRAKMDELMQKRKEKQPLEYPSCGSAFKRPEGHFAGALIEQCGLKGFSVGNAQVSEKHAGFIINRGNATATDVITLLSVVSDKVFEQTGIRLEPEIKIAR